VTFALQVTVPQSDRHDTGVMYTKMTVKQLKDDAPWVRCSIYSSLRQCKRRRFLLTIITLATSCAWIVSVIMSQVKLI